MNKNMSSPHRRSRTGLTQRGWDDEISKNTGPGINAAEAAHLLSQRRSVHNDDLPSWQDVIEMTSEEYGTSANVSAHIASPYYEEAKRQGSTAPLEQLLGASPTKFTSLTSSRSPVKTTRSASPVRSPVKTASPRSASPVRSPVKTASPRSASPVRSASPTRTSSRSASPIRSASPTRTPQRTSSRSASPVRPASPTRTPQRTSARTVPQAPIKSTFTRQSVPPLNSTGVLRSYKPEPESIRKLGARIENGQIVGLSRPAYDALIAQVTGPGVSAAQAAEMLAPYIASEKEAGMTRQEWRDAVSQTAHKYGVNASDAAKILSQTYQSPRNHELPITRVRDVTLKTGSSKLRSRSPSVDDSDYFPTISGKRRNGIPDNDAQKSYDIATASAVEAVQANRSPTVRSNSRAKYLLESDLRNIARKLDLDSFGDQESLVQALRDYGNQ